MTGRRNAEFGLRIADCFSPSLTEFFSQFTPSYLPKTVHAVFSCLPAGRSAGAVDESVVWHTYIARGLGEVEAFSILLFYSLCYTLFEINCRQRVIIQKRWERYGSQREN